MIGRRPLSTSLSFFKIMEMLLTSKASRQVLILQTSRSFDFLGQHIIIEVRAQSSSSSSSMFLLFLALINLRKIFLPFLKVSIHIVLDLYNLCNYYIEATKV